jgi:hypothetical protein
VRRCISNYGVSVDLNFVRLIFTMELEVDCAEPYALFGLRPYFAESFRLSSGCGSSRCRPCGKGENCPYHHAFSQALSTDPSALRRYQKPSLPFLFDIPILPPPPNRGTIVEVGLSVIGSAVPFTSVYIAAMTALLHAAGFRDRVKTLLLKVESEDCGGARRTVMTPDTSGDALNLSILSLEGLQQTAVLPVDFVTINIITPIRLMADGKTSKEFIFSQFIRTMFRRISSLAYYYGGEETDLDFRLLAAQSLLISTAVADFHWIEWTGRLSGLIGTGTFTGDMVDYHPFLIAGEYLHAGKGASFGLGRFFVADAARDPCKTGITG